MHRYRIRRLVAAGTSATVPLPVLVTATILIQPVTLGITVGLLVAAALFTPSYVRVRRRTLTVTDEGLEVQRDQYRLFVPWRGVRKVQRRRHQVLLAVEELVVTDAHVAALDRRGRTTSVPNRLSNHPAQSRVMVSLYDKQWRRGPIGDRLRLDGVLDPTRRSGPVGDP